MSDDLSGQEVPPEDLPENLQSAPAQGPQSGDPVPQEDLPDAALSGQEVPPHDLPDELNPAAQQGTEASFEGYMRGATAGVSDALAKGMRSGASALGVPDEDLHYIAPDPTEMAARKESNPNIAGASEFLGNATALSKLLPEMGSKALTGLVQMGIMGGGDELSKAMLGQGDPTVGVISHIAENGALGLIGGKLFGAVEDKGLKYLENSKLGTQIKSLLAGVGHAASNPGTEVSSLSALKDDSLKGLSDISFKAGQGLYKHAGSIAASTAGAVAGGVTGGFGHGLTAGAQSGFVEGLLEKAFGPYVGALSKKYLAPTMMKIATSQPVENISKVLDNNLAQSRGFQKIEKGVQGLFSSGTNKALDYEFSDAKNNTLRKYIMSGGPLAEAQQQAPQGQGYAEGGEVQPSVPGSIDQVYPEQSVLRSATKSRVFNYLNGIRPLKANKLPYDTDQPDPTKEREYEKTLNLANQPLSILSHIKKGSLLPKHVKDFVGMYPELHDHLSKRITEEVTKQELAKKEKPPYHVRQAMSLFLGTSLDSTLTPQSMMAAQATFIQQKAQNAGDAKAKALNETAKNSQTPEQSREERLTKN